MFLGANCEQIDSSKSICELPDDLKGGIDTFVINPKISCGANIFINTLPTIGALTMKELKEKEKKDPNIVSRKAYHKFTEFFAKIKIPLEVDNFKIERKPGKNINLRRYSGKNTDKVILYVHGGGWSRGDLDTHDAICREICHRTEYSVVATDYRLAPEHPYPAGLEDVEKAYEWILNNYNDKKVIFCGDSAGGNLATALTIKRLQENKKGPDGLLLLYPALDLRIPEKTYDPTADGYFLTRTRTNDYIKIYLGKNFKELVNTPLVSPIIATDEILGKLPPTLIIGAEYDPLTASSKEFVEKARNASAPIDLKIIKGTIHIFAQFPELFTEANEALNLLADWAKDKKTKMPWHDKLIKNLQELLIKLSR